MENHYDLIVIGAGPGGYTAAAHAAGLGLKTLVVEKDKPGGVCLNIGCIPTKSLIDSAKTYRSLARLQAWGVKADVSGFDFRACTARAQKASAALSQGVQFLFKQHKVEYLPGTARLKSPDTVEVNGRPCQAKYILLATGSRPKSLPGLVIDEVNFLSSTAALKLEKLPKSLVIIGAGAIGCEFAFIFRCFGVEVTLVEYLDQILPLEDPEGVRILARAFRKQGINVFTGSQVVSAAAADGGVKITVKQAGAGQTLAAEKALVAVGREPFTAGFGLEELGLIGPKGFVPVDDYYRTSFPSVFAIGDLIPTPPLAHVAAAEGKLAVETMAGRRPEKLDYTAVPAACYCEPQVASFGLTEAAAQNQGITAKKAVCSFKACGKAVALEETDGQVKLVFEAGSGRILGSQIVGPEATEIIHELLLAKVKGLTVRDVAAVLHGHPTLSESLREAAAAGQP